MATVELNGGITGGGEYREFQPQRLRDETVGLFNFLNRLYTSCEWKARAACGPTITLQLSLQLFTQHQ